LYSTEHTSLSTRINYLSTELSTYRAFVEWQLLHIFHWKRIR